MYQFKVVHALGTSQQRNMNSGSRCFKFLFQSYEREFKNAATDTPSLFAFIFSHTTGKTLGSQTALCSNVSLCVQAQGSRIRGQAALIHILALLGSVCCNLLVVRRRTWGGRGTELLRHEHSRNFIALKQLTENWLTYYSYGSINNALIAKVIGDVM